MVCGNLRDAATDLEGRGLLVHRSHWVASAHVTSVVRRGRDTVCLLDNGDEVAVSRRRRAEVVAQFGEGVRLTPAPAKRSEGQPGQDSGVT